MFSEQFFDLVLDFGDNRKVDDVKVNFKPARPAGGPEEVDVFVSYIGSKVECPDTYGLCSMHDRRASRRWRHLDTMQYKTLREITRRDRRNDGQLGATTYRH